jgi:hypothetical protein
MKKLITIAALTIAILSSSKTAFAANPVSEMAVNKGGRAVAECAKMMEQGVSSCVTGSGCNMQPVE